MNASQRSLAAFRAMEADRNNLENTVDLLTRQVASLNDEVNRMQTLKENAQDAAHNATVSSEKWMHRALSAEAKLVALRDALQSLDKFVVAL